MDTGSTFNSTNDKELIINVMQTCHRITLRTNAGQRQMSRCGETPGLTNEMWLDEKSMITILSFAKLAEKKRIQCDNWNGESFQVHAEVGVMKFKKSTEGLHYHEFSQEFIDNLKISKAQDNHEAQSVATVEGDTEGYAKQQQE